MKLADRAALTALSLIALPLAASAQSEAPSREALRACAGLESESARLDCIDAALSRAETDAREVERGAAAASEPDTRRAPAAERNAAREAAPETARERSTASHSYDRESLPRTVVIVEVRSLIPGEAVFRTAEGERFVQTSGSSRLFLPDVPYEAELRSGAIGGLFLAPIEQGRTVRVARPD